MTIIWILYFRLLFFLLLWGKSAESIIIPDVAYDPGESDSSLALSLHTLALFS